MFTGLVQALGRIQAIEQKGKDCRLQIESREFDIAGTNTGDSISINGVCLTAYDLSEHAFQADVSIETLSCTTLGDWSVGQVVNLEASLQPTSRLGGHFVSGHVDGVGTLTTINQDGRSQRMSFEVPSDIARYIAAKGSVCIDGVSLTVNHAEACRFDVNIIPHTLQHTTLGSYTAGQKINLEVDLIARYLERLLQGDVAGQGNATADISRALLIEQGYLTGVQGS